jgi:hypothetical protein
MRLYPKIVQQVISHSDHGDMEKINSWLAKVMECSVPKGKRIAGAQHYLSLPKADE